MDLHPITLTDMNRRHFLQTSSLAALSTQASAAENFCKQVDVSARERLVTLGMPHDADMGAYPMTTGLNGPLDQTQGVQIRSKVLNSQSKPMIGVCGTPECGARPARIEALTDGL